MVDPNIKVHGYYLETRNSTDASDEFTCEECKRSQVHPCYGFFVHAFKLISPLLCIDCTKIALQKLVDEVDKVMKES